MQRSAEKTNKQINDVISSCRFDRIRTLKQKNVLQSLFPSLQRISLPHTHAIHILHRNHNHIHIQSILNDWWSMLATLITIIQPHTRTRGLVLGKQIQIKTHWESAESELDEEKERSEEKCEFQRIQRTYFNLNSTIGPLFEPIRILYADTHLFGNRAHIGHDIISNECAA